RPRRTRQRTANAAGGRYSAKELYAPIDHSQVAAAHQTSGPGGAAPASTDEHDTANECRPAQEPTLRSIKGKGAQVLRPLPEVCALQRPRTEGLDSHAHISCILRLPRDFL